MSEPNDAFDTWWTEHYSMANLARGAAEDAWRAATEHAAKIADEVERQQDDDNGAANTGGAAQTAAAIRGAHE